MHKCYEESSCIVEVRGSNPRGGTCKMKKELKRKGLKRIIKIRILSTILLVIILWSISSLTGCKKDNAIEKCIQLCQEAKTKGINLSRGPCLSDIVTYEVEDYVCDVAHSPREDIDNMRENQCKEFRNGLKHHFVEVSPECKFIRMR